MPIRPVPLLAIAFIAALLLAAAPLHAQPAGRPGPRIDVLTGEPVRPPRTNPRPEPEIFNAPHAPEQTGGERRESPPIEILVSPPADVGGTLPNAPIGRRY